MTTITKDNKTYRLQQDAYISDNGDFYKAHAIDANGNDYRIIWPIKSEYLGMMDEVTDESILCDWNNCFDAILM